MMYEDNDDVWDEFQTDGAMSQPSGDWKVTAGGFLIVRYDAELRRLRCLQIGTGQWCDFAHATVFPLRSTAEIYALEFGYVVGATASVIHRRFA